MSSDPYSNINIERLHISWNGVFNLFLGKSCPKEIELIKKSELNFPQPPSITQTGLKSRKTFAIYLSNARLLKNPINFHDADLARLTQDPSFIKLHRRIKGQLKEILRQKTILIRGARLRSSHDDLENALKDIMKKYKIDVVDMRDISTEILDNMMIKKTLGD